MSRICLRIYLTEKQRHQNMLLYEWLLKTAKEIGIEGGSVFRSIAGYGRHGQLHDESFFELAGELPIQVEFVLKTELAEKFITMLREHKLKLFYIRYDVESGYL